MRAKDILSKDYSRYINVFESPDRKQFNKMQRIYSKMETRRSSTEKDQDDEGPDS